MASLFSRVPIGLRSAVNEGSFTRIALVLTKCRVDLESFLLSRGSPILPVRPPRVRLALPDSSGALPCASALPGQSARHTAAMCTCFVLLSRHVVPHCGPVHLFRALAPCTGAHGPSSSPSARRSACGGWSPYPPSGRHRCVHCAPPPRHDAAVPCAVQRRVRTRRDPHPLASNTRSPASLCSMLRPAIDRRAEHAVLTSRSCELASPASRSQAKLLMREAAFLAGA